MRRILQLPAIFFLAIILLRYSPPCLAQSAQGINSGSFQLIFENQSGNSVYTILYSYPTTVQWGSNFTITTTVEVNNLTGLELYLKDYGITVTVISSNGYSAMGQVLGGSPEAAGPPSQQPTSGHLYQGSRWGPVQTQIPINRGQFGNPPDQSLNTSISLQFVADVQNDRSANSGTGVTHYDIGSRIVGSLVIGPENQTMPLYYLYAATAGVLAIIGFVILRKFHKF